jgi:predicted RNA binding protein YcfA (HicA-like mRNA interferase family)
MAGRLVPCSRAEFIRKLRRLGYDGPFAGGKHAHMTKAGNQPVIIPNPHQGDISVALLAKILRDAGIDRDAFLAG